MISAGLVYAIGLPALLLCSALTIGTLLLSTSVEEEEIPEEISGTTYLARL